MHNSLFMDNHWRKTRNLKFFHKQITLAQKQIVDIQAAAVETLEIPLSFRDTYVRLKQCFPRLGTDLFHGGPGNLRPIGDHLKAFVQVHKSSILLCGVIENRPTSYQYSDIQLLVLLFYDLKPQAVRCV